MRVIKSDFEIIRHRFPGAIKIYPISDVHFGAINCQEKEWTRFCSMILNEPDAYVLLGGDLLNFNTRSAVGSPFDDTIRPREQKTRMVEYLEPLVPRILAMVSGNHERRGLKDADDDPTYDIACKLDIEDIYRQNAAFVTVGLGHKNRSKGRTNDPWISYNIALTHGAGGGIYTGATVNRNERWGNLMNADLVVVGHTHKGTVTRPSRLLFDSRCDKVMVREYVVISCVAWQSYGEYSLQKMLLPSQTARPQVLYLNDRERDIEVRW